MTTATCAGMAREAHASRIAWRFDPDPDASTPMRMLRDDHFGLSEPFDALDRADLERRLTPARENVDGARRLAPGDHGAHADPHVERAQHLRLGDLARFLDAREDLGHGPRAAPQRRSVSVGQDAGQVSGKPAARDVRKGLHLDRVAQREAFLDVNPRRLQELAGEIRSDVAVEHLAGQGEAVRMQARRGHPDHDVRGLHPRTIQDPALLHHADAEAREVVFAARIETRQLGGLATDQRAPGPQASFRDAFDHLLRFRHVEEAGGEVVEEDDGLGAADHHVIHAHRDQVDADGVVLAGQERELQLGSHAVGSDHEHGFAVPLGNLEEPSEAADARQDLGPGRAPGERLDPLHQGVALLDVDTGVAVREPFVRHRARTLDSFGPRVYTSFRSATGTDPKRRTWSRRVVSASRNARRSAWRSLAVTSRLSTFSMTSPGCRPASAEGDRAATKSTATAPPSLVSVSPLAS